MKTLRSDTKLSPQASAIVLRRVAVVALDDARTRWTAANKDPSVRRVRAAFRSCVLAARALREAAAVLPLEAEQMIEAAKRIEAASKELNAKLARIVEGADPAPSRR